MKITKNEINEISKIYEKLSIKMASDIWNNPEESFNEFYASNLIRDVLVSHDFNIQKEICLETGIMASFGKSNSKNKVAILGEYDALYGTSNNESKTMYGHGCGHNLLGIGSLHASIVLSKLIKKHKLDLQIIYYGCPAEEKGAGKAIMEKNELFKNVDACFTWHPAAKNSITNDIWIGSKIVKIDFIGKESHASMSKDTGINANNMMIKFLNYFSKFSGNNTSYIINNNKQSLSLTPKNASIDIAIRAFSEKRINNIYQKIEKFLASNFLKNQIIIKTKENYPVTKHSLFLQDIVYDNFKLFAPSLKFTLVEQKLATNKLKGISKQEQLNNLRSMNIPVSWYGEPFNKSILYSKKIHYVFAPTDVGAISSKIPTIQFQTICMPLGISVHTSQATEFTNTSIGHKGMILAGKVIVGSVLSYINLK